MAGSLADETAGMALGLSRPPKMEPFFFGEGLAARGERWRVSQSAAAVEGRDADEGPRDRGI